MVRTTAPMPDYPVTRLADWLRACPRVAVVTGAGVSTASGIPDCPRCGGMLKPDVVFYGESVPAAHREQAMAMVNAADGILVVGSSLMVWSSFRLVRAAAVRGASIAAINQGHTRADDLLAVKCVGDGGEILRQVLDDLDAAS